ncbi:unnamed protein product [Fusarium graminearum]|uniref:Uncharacterized protein n=1 Tax=Gibberella zeae TaxID=5518 RepID=A0A9N8RG66_GIBZA|nr:unnamed protein product [Fusarium graminearum]CAF3626604.1 unnamed protein product [Fusarium graminearum]CAG1985143.1 unnamed protein product [Fusarium graminearum]CAG1989635.1 unnamed protein product [Fusarium graminearum]CZS77802.1 unnamed protein product [Fusarium graminearum]
MAFLPEAVSRLGKRLLGTELFTLANTNRLFMRQSTTPAICYGDCNAAYKIAQSVGKSVELCLSNSSFQLAYESCKNCTEGNTKSDGNSTQEDQLPQFSPYLDFCGNFSEGSLTVAPTSTPTDCAELYSTLKAPNLSQRRWNTQSTPETLPPRRGPISYATIVGPVVPSVVLLLLVGFLGFRWFKRRRASKAATGPAPNEEDPKESKPQLHSDCITRPTFELEGSVPIVPDDTVHTKDKAEMSANEPAAHEMSGDKKISRKPVGLQIPGGTQLSEDRRNSIDFAE